MLRNELYTKMDFCYQSNCAYKKPVVMLIKNNKEYQLDLQKKMNCANIQSRSCMDYANTILKEKGVLLVLCNIHKLSTLKKVLQEYKGSYNVCFEKVKVSDQCEYIIEQIISGSTHTIRLI